MFVNITEKPPWGSVIKVITLLLHYYYLFRVSLAFAYDLRRRSRRPADSRHRVQATTSARA